MPWWRDAVIYQIYPRSFSDSTGDGVGDLPGIRGHLEYVSSTLGVDAIWLSPFYPSPMADFGYDVADYCDVDPSFGTLADFDALVREAHERGLRVVIDFVPNHSSDQHPWFREARASRDSAKRDWYVFRDPKPDGSPPNNWLSNFGGPAWTLDEQTGQYYLHSFLPQQPDLDWRNPQVERAMLDVLRFWLDRGVDGFRIDVAHAIMKDPQLRDNPPNDGPIEFHKARAEYDTQLHVHDAAHPDVHGAFRRIRSVVDGYARDAVTIGEIHDYDLARWVGYYGEHGDELHMPFNFGLLRVPFEAEAVAEHVESMESTLPPSAWPNYVLGNHDESRLATRLGPDRVRLAAFLLLTTRGTPTLYYGDELGMQDVAVPPERQRDPWGLRVKDLSLSRDPCRTPMRWTPGGSAGFSTRGPDDLWLPMGNGTGTVNVQSELADPASVLNLYRALLGLRRERAALRRGSVERLTVQSPSVYAFVRRHGDERIAIAMNFGAETARVSLPAPGRVLLGTRMGMEGDMDTTSLELGPRDAVAVLLPG